MGTFSDASVQDIKRLLELFPIANLRRAWPEFKGTKEEVCQASAETKNFDRIAQFVDEHSSDCKQHVYVFYRDENLTGLPKTLLGESPARILPNTRALFILRTTYNVVLRDPLEDSTLDFLWPIRVELSPDKVYVVLRFVVLEKTVSAYFDRQCFTMGRSIDEKNVIKDVEYWAKNRADLHKGIKELWKDKFMDSPSAKQKKTLSVAEEIMDEERGIREHNPELFQQILDNMVMNALFLVADESCGTDVFSAKPSEGFLGFPRYSEKGGTDFVISEILRSNQ